MGPLISLIGQRFGRLVVLSKTEDSQCGSVMWLCKCDCGNEVEVNGASLRYSRTHSCGCLAIETGAKNAKEDAARNKVFGAYKARAKTNSLEFSLTDEQFDNFVLSPCYYCGAEPSHITRSFAGECFVHNGIDRVDSKKGYTEENCVSCCWPCNLMKRETPLKEFMDRVLSIARYRGGDYV
jgi:hypothetical protein